MEESELLEDKRRLDVESTRSMCNKQKIIEGK